MRPTRLTLELGATLLMGSLIGCGSPRPQRGDAGVAPGSGGAAAGTGGIGAGGAPVAGCGDNAPSTPAPADISIEGPPTSSGSSWLGLLVSTGGHALVYADSAAGLYTWRRRPGSWAPSGEPLPEGQGLLAGAISPDGTAHLAWASRREGTEGVKDFFVRAWRPDGGWSDTAHIGDSGTGWWQEPVTPRPTVVARADGSSLLAWARIDQAAPGWPQAVWSNRGNVSEPWPDASPLGPGTHDSVSAPGLWLRETGETWAAWTSWDATGMNAVWVAERGTGDWGSPLMVDQAGGDVRFNADQSAPTLAISSTGEIVLVYSRSNTAGWELLARYSRDGVLWSAPETIPTPAGSTSFRVTSNDAGGVLVTSDAGGVPPSIAATIYVPGRGWSASTSLARGRNSGARIALHADGRAAVAHVNVFDPTTMCVHPGVVVHRYTPAAGWSPAESIDDLANGVADIGWSGDELIAAWHRPDQHAYAKALR